MAAKSKERNRFEDYYDHREPLRHLPSHNYLAVARGEAEGFLKVAVEEWCGDLAKDYD